MIGLADSREMKAIDSYSIDTVGIPSMVLMERAAYAVALKIRSVLEHTHGDKNCGVHKGRESTQRSRDSRGGFQVIAVCGSGNNGGDGLAAVRILYTMGYKVSWYMAGDMSRATKQTRQQIAILKNLGIGPCSYPQDLMEAEVLVDALFGIGLTRPVSGHFAEVIDTMNRSAALVCAVDMPSGVSADNGQAPGSAVQADFTVTFGKLKPGLVLYPGAGLAGQVSVENIGFAPEAADIVEIHTFAYEMADISALLPARRAYSNKGSYGRVLVIAGSPTMAGACYFSAGAAYRCGCGLVRVFTVRENHDVILEKLPEAVLSIYDPQQMDAAEAMLKEALSWADSVVLGPGLSTDVYAGRLVAYTLKNCRVPMVIDADGLNLLAKEPKLWELVPGGAVLTPHIGEMSRLTGRKAEALTSDIIGACRDFAREHHVVCALKDARTVISDGTQTWINLSGNDGMATGGSGDVLSGIIGAFLAGGLAPLRAASLGCFVHGCAGDAARSVKGAYGLLASDIIQYLSNVLR